LCSWFRACDGFGDELTIIYISSLYVYAYKKKIYIQVGKPSPNPSHHDSPLVADGKALPIRPIFIGVCSPIYETEARHADDVATQVLAMSQAGKRPGDPPLPGRG